jgi:hypothetical protein
LFFIHIDIAKKPVPFNRAPTIGGHLLPSVSPIIVSKPVEPSGFSKTKMWAVLTFFRPP